MTKEHKLIDHPNFTDEAVKVGNLFADRGVVTNTFGDLEKMLEAIYLKGLEAGVYGGPCSYHLQQYLDNIKGVKETFSAAEIMNVLEAYGYKPRAIRNTVQTFLRQGELKPAGFGVYTDNRKEKP